MKLLASDVDGTLIHSHGEMKQSTIDAIAAWRKAGHVFAFVTGRDLWILRRDVDKLNIPFDYAICNNGGVIYDANYQPLHEASIAGSLVKQIVEDPIVKDSLYYILSGLEDRYLVEGKQLTDRNYYTNTIQVADIDQHDYYGIDLLFENVEKMDGIAAQLEAKYGDQIAINKNIDSIDINGLGSNKSTGVHWLVENKLTQTSDVLVVGDGQNDVQMIKDYHGYTMVNATEDIQDMARDVIDDVAKIIDTHI